MPSWPSSQIINNLNHLQYISSRWYFASFAVVSFLALVLVYLLQHVGGLTPCPLCIFQRIAMAFVFLFSLPGLIHGATGWPHKFYAGLIAMASLAGVGLAARQVWLMHLPLSEVPTCGLGLNTMIEMMPLHDVVVQVLKGDASCAQVKGSFAGLSIPEWSFIGFGMLSLISIGGLFGLIAGQKQQGNKNKTISK